MNDIAIRVDGLSKQYRIGGKQERYKTLRDTLTDAFAAPFRRLSSVVRGQSSTVSNNNFIWALKDVSFEVKRGEVIGIIGRNGAGKTTLLKILSRITEPTEGYAEIHGRVGSLLEVGTGFHPELTGRENILLNGAILGMTRAEIDRKFDEIVDFSGVEKFIDTPVKRYSSGMHVRLAFSVAAHLEPEILLVDEVLAVGDAAFQKKCLGKMGEVARAGRTVLFVSHNMIALQSLCERAIWLETGAIMEDGLSSQVVPKYLQKSSVGTNTVEQVWAEIESAPGNDQVRIHRVFVRSGYDHPRLVPTVDTELEVGVEFWSLLPAQNLNVTLHVVASNAVIAFSTSTAHHIALRETILHPGLYYARCHIPANLLNNGIYRIRLLIVQDQARTVVTMEDVLEFEVLDSTERRGAYFGKRPGVVAPICRWEMKQL
ncbi:MAG: ABC transporter ATP-binding protein [Ardenticatenaceae bacterium]|nr:ABC transporter ATP-binding protein [Ardenticatenaceae bacterium]